ncbi:TonB-dependent siderophore receptor [Roseateles albus]|uniref:TonB-dependent siderophore receptor n=1 Tax=Roseateles albus TaxID=2987525 RepID=A0ABT5KKV7_9BURK|nr:TonB-dependent siderophore receptor [Roseateles albus]MDC8773461.1 TonB-dependent siderophore receptor [Roseateles albus]
MKKNIVVTACALATALYAAEYVQAQEATLEKIVVTGKRANRISKGATGLALELKETPQSISSIDKDEMADFGLTGSNEALGLATGINVEQYETNRAIFNARGFEIQLTQIDGLGMTNSWGTVVGREDTFLFESIELVRGANGLLTGVGNASGTINYIRKRPKNEASTQVIVSAGSHALKRVALDYNKVLTQDGAWAARLVLAHEDRESHLRDLRDKRTTVYGVVDGQIGRDGVLTVGVTAVDAKQDSPMWGSLTLLRSDGTQAEFPVGSSTSQHWTYWNTKSVNAFVEYAHRLGEDWDAKLTYNNRQGDESTRLLYAYSNSGMLNPDNTGLVGWPYRSIGDSDSQVLDANLSGKFSAFGRKHDLLVGLSRSTNKTADDSYAALTHAADALPAFPFGGDVYAEPEWGPRLPRVRGEQTLTRLYGVSRIAIADGLKGILGVNAVRLERSGASIYGAAATNTVYPDTQEVSPYVGITYDVTPDVVAYASYSDIFQNQDQTDKKGEYLAPMKGVNTEIGVKAEWLNKSLLSTFALFAAKQQGLATLAGKITDVPTTDPLYNQDWYEGKDVDSKGLEIELSGRISKDTRLTLGFTRLILTGDDNKDASEWVPRNVVNFRADTRIPLLPALRVGVGGRWQADVFKVGGPKQDAYLVANAFAAYAVTQDATLRLNVNNLLDKKYIGGLVYGAMYGAPRNLALTLEYKL